jgi:multiple antibiotic resistance protein
LALNWQVVVQSVIALLVITAPPDPAKVLLFNSIIEEQGLNRSRSAMKVAIIVFCILGGAAFGGDEIAKLLGIDLNAFSVVGGIVVAGMGFEMLYGGSVSKTQGKEVREGEPDESAGLIMPLSIPLIAGPGAIVTAVTISTSNTTAGYDWLLALVGAGSVALATFASFQWLGGLLARLPANATSLMLRLGGMLLATIGVQMLLGGLNRYFAV